MTEQQLQRKLNQLRKISNELVDEAQHRFGPQGNLFFESEGNFHIMDGDSDGSTSTRQAHVRFTSTGHSRMGAGAW